MTQGMDASEWGTLERSEGTPAKWRKGPKWYLVKGHAQNHYLQNRAHKTARGSQQRRS